MSEGGTTTPHWTTCVCTVLFWVLDSHRDYMGWSIMWVAFLHGVRVYICPHVFDEPPSAVRLHTLSSNMRASVLHCARHFVLHQHVYVCLI